MRHEHEVPDEFVVPLERFDNEAWVQQRIDAAPPADRGGLGTALRYLYILDGPTNLPNERKVAALPHLEPREQILAKWLATRTNGSERANYGKDALLAARGAKYRCADCGMPDVRVLHLDHVHGRGAVVRAFRCLCANCHQIKSRRRSEEPHLWTPVRRLSARAAIRCAPPCAPPTESARFQGSNSESADSP